MKHSLVLLLLISSTFLFSQTSDSINFDSLRIEIKKKWSKKFYNQIHPDYEAAYDYVITDKKTNLMFRVDTMEIRVSAINKKGEII